MRAGLLTVALMLSLVASAEAGPKDRTAKAPPAPPTLSLANPQTTLVNYPEERSLFWRFGMDPHPQGNGLEQWVDLPDGDACGWYDPYPEPDYFYYCGLRILRFPFKGSVIGQTAILLEAQALNMGGAPQLTVRAAWKGPYTSDPAWAAWHADPPTNGTPDNGGQDEPWLSVVLITKDASGDYGRWYSFLRGGVPVAADGQPYAARIDLNDPSVWSSVYGHRADSSSAALAGWNKAKASLTEIGLGAGGGWFAAHGVAQLGGAVRLVIRAFRFE